MRLHPILPGNAGGAGERLVQVGHELGRIFQPDREPDQAALVGGGHRVATGRGFGHHGGKRDDRHRAADARHVRNRLEPFDDAHGDSRAADRLEGEDAPGAAGQQVPRELAPTLRRKARVANACDRRVRPKKRRDGGGGFAGPGHPRRQCPDAAQREPGVERVQGRAGKVGGLPDRGQQGG